MNLVETLTAALKLGFAIGICLLPGLIGTPFTDTDPGSWYQNLEQPDFNPPDWVFGPVWSFLYVLNGVALYLIWTRRESRFHWRLLLATFISQLVANALWTPAFFGLESPVAGLVVIVPLLILIGASIALAWRYSKTASILLVPYIAWVSYATLLVFSIWRMN